jgi:two-component system, cell cycle sensor histidine kinase and response regulator CckA
MSTNSVVRPPSRPPTLDLRDLSVAQVVHDLRNQLTIMMGCADTLAWLVPKGRADHELSELLRCGERASLLALELLQASPARPPARPVVELNQLITRTAHSFARIAGDRICLRLRFSAEPLPVRAATVEIERVLLNLALNACDAMAGDGMLTIETATTGSSARMTVTDTGCGMTPEVQARMFEPFYSTKEDAVGLGLTSVAHTVKQLQGAIFVDTARARGTSITVVLPMVP